MLPDCGNSFKIAKMGIFCDKRYFHHFCCSNDDFIMEFKDLFGLYHLQKNDVVERKDNIVFAFCDAIKKVFKIKNNLFLSNMLRHSAITMDGIKMIHSPLSHLSKMFLAFSLIFGLSVKCHRRAWVSVRKFMCALNLYLTIKRLLGFFNILLRYFNAFKDPLKGDNFFGRRGKFLED